MEKFRFLEKGITQLKKFAGHFFNSSAIGKNVSGILPVNDNNPQVEISKSLSEQSQIEIENLNQETKNI